MLQGSTLVENIARQLSAMPADGDIPSGVLPQCLKLAGLAFQRLQKMDFALALVAFLQLYVLFVILREFSLHLSRISRMKRVPGLGINKHQDTQEKLERERMDNVSSTYYGPTSNAPTTHPVDAVVSDYLAGASYEAALETPQSGNGPKGDNDHLTALAKETTGEFKEVQHSVDVDQGSCLTKNFADAPLTMVNSPVQTQSSSSTEKCSVASYTGEHSRIMGVSGSVLSQPSSASPEKEFNIDLAADVLPFNRSSSIDESPSVTVLDRQMPETLCVQSESHVLAHVISTDPRDEDSLAIQNQAPLGGDAFTHSSDENGIMFGEQATLDSTSITTEKRAKVSLLAPDWRAIVLEEREASSKLTGPIRKSQEVTPIPLHKELCSKPHAKEAVLSSNSALTPNWREASVSSAQLMPSEDTCAASDQTTSAPVCRTRRSRTVRKFPRASDVPNWRNTAPREASPERQSSHREFVKRSALDTHARVKSLESGNAGRAPRSPILVADNQRELVQRSHTDTRGGNKPRRKRANSGGRKDGGRTESSKAARTRREEMKDHKRKLPQAPNWKELALKGKQATIG